MRYLVDTCVWRDFYEDRKNRHAVSLGRPAVAAFLRIISKRSEILICQTIVKELSKAFSREKIEEMLGFISATGHLRWIEPTRKEVEEARTLATARSLPFADCLFAVLAKNHGAIVVTRDYHLLRRLKDVVVALRPEEID